MSTPKINTEFAHEVRAELTAIGTKSSRLQRHQRKTRTVAWTLGTLALVGVTTGAAVVVNSFPGSTTVAPVGTTVTVTHTGTGTIDLGPAPANAEVVVIDLTCVNNIGQAFIQSTPGDDLAATASGINCVLADKPMHVGDGLLPVEGTTTITVRAEPGTTWKATAQYATSTTSPWGVNANGQTYGVSNGHGVPDLTPARTDDGKPGYVFSKEVDELDPSVGDVIKINVYEKDGTTVIGTYEVRTMPSIPIDPTLTPYGAATESPNQ